MLKVLFYSPRQIASRISLLLFCAWLSPGLLAEVDYTQREEVKAFAEEMAAEHGFTADGILMVMGQARYNQKVIDYISRPAEKTLTWKEYQDIFLTDSRVKGGREFIVEHKDAFRRAWETYGVPASVISAVIGVETLYGKRRGTFRVLDALATLAFDYPPRSKFFRSELKQFLLLVREEEQSVTDLLGSYAGAMGYGQFIPSSYRNYAVDFNGDGVRDIWNDPVDAIGSVASYLARHGWQQDSTIVVPATVKDAPASEKLFNQSLKPSVSVADLISQGVEPAVEVDGGEIAAPFLYRGKQGDEYWLGLKNFYVITRYNHSKLYAMAVYQLSERIESSTNQLASF